MKYVIAALLAALATPAPAPAPPSTTAQAIATPYFIQIDLVKRIDCGKFLGTGSVIDSDLVLTAYHVVAHRQCAIDGKPVHLAFADPENDYAVVRTEAKYSTRIPISCNGVREGREYFAIGYAFGSDFVVQRLIGTKSNASGRFNGMSVMRGNNYPGMSGGPIVDDTGYIVGIVNAAPKNGLSLALSRKAADMYVCDRAD